MPAALLCDSVDGFDAITLWEDKTGQERRLLYAKIDDGSKVSVMVVNPWKMIMGRGFG
jgi:hypothetical protein